MSNNATGTDGGAERRRYVRLPMRLDALVAIDGRPAVQCTVRDFCVAGLFVAISQQQLRLVKPQTSAVLFFSLVVDGVQSDYQLTLQIFRVVGSGFGCGFKDADPQTIALLQSLAASSNPKAAPDTPEGLSQTQGNFSEHFREAKEPLSELVQKFGRRTAEEFLRLVDEALFLAARDAGNNVEETRFLDGQNEIGGRRDDISEMVPNLLQKGVAILNSPLNTTQEETSGPAVSELSLIDKDEFEEFLTVSQLVSDLEPRFKEDLFQLDRRFSLLAKREVDDRSNPLGPAVVGGIFAEALKNLRSDRSAVNVIYRTLRQVLESNLGRLYSDANEMLVELGVLPVIEKEKSTIKRGESTSSSVPAGDALLDSTPGGQSLPSAPSAPPGSQQPHPGYGQRAQAGGVPGAPGVGPGTAVPLDAMHPGQVPYTGGVQAGPVQAGSLQPGAVQADSVQSDTAQAGSVQPGAAGAGQAGVAAGSTPVGMGPEASFGFGGGPAVHVPPSLQRAYSTAQAQMALRRDLLPLSESEAITVSGTGPTYAPAQVIEGLTKLQQSLADMQDAPTLDVRGIKERIIDAITRAGGDAGSIGQSESDAIEVIANLFDVLIEDALVNDSAKAQLTKLQAPVHKAALMDPAFFEATDHPVRQLLNRVSMLRDGLSETAGQRNDRVTELIGRINSEFGDDIGVFEPILGEFDDILREQRDAYNEKVSAVVHASEEQEKILHARRDKNLEATGFSLAQQELPEEWNRWLDRGKLLESGKRMIMNANTNNPSLVTLVWVGPGFNPYVFVDDRGEKASTLTLQQVAMYLRRGTLKSLQDDDAGPVDRALFGVVNRIHGEVEVRATHDELTDFMNRKSFVQAIERHRPDGAAGSSGAVLCQLSLTNLKAINDEYGVEVGDTMLNNVARQLRAAIPGKVVTFGRLGGTDLGMFWPKGGLQGAYKKLLACIESLPESAAVESGDAVLAPEAYAGITAIEDGLTTAGQLLTVVSEACNTARRSQGKPVYVAGSENKYREQLEQMVGYIGKAYDRDRLVLLRQTVTSLADDGDQPAVHVVVSAEDRNGKLVPPGFFKQALANSDRAFEIDEWTLKKTFSWMAEHSDDVDSFAAVIIPLSHEAMKRDDLSNVIINLLMETAVPPGKIFFEIADKDVIANVTETAELVRTLKEFGCRFILDEFGSGQGNYDYVKELAIDFVTIETGFIAEAKQNPKDFAMAKSINELIHFMGKKTIGKQDAGNDVVDVLREIGVDFLYDQSKTSRIAA
jgi:diguanylate cyclase (GGDEF)-like protein